MLLDPVLAVLLFERVLHFQKKTHRSKIKRKQRHKTRKKQCTRETDPKIRCDTLSQLCFTTCVSVRCLQKKCSFYIKTHKLIQTTSDVRVCKFTCAARTSVVSYHREFGQEQNKDHKPGSLRIEKNSGALSTVRSLASIGSVRSVG